jgi:hypothetical protein
MKAEIRDRIGKLSWGAGPTEIELMLAPTDVPIAKSFTLPVLPPSYDPEEFTVNEPTNEAVRRWKISRFGGGEGAAIWDATSDEYHESYGVIPSLNRFEGGLVLQPQAARTFDDVPNVVSGVDALYTRIRGLYYIDGQTFYAWDSLNEEWDSTGNSTGAASGFAYQGVGVDGQGWHYAIYSIDELWRYTASSQEKHVAATAWPTSGFGPFCLASKDGRLFAVDAIDANLLEIDTVTADTVTAVGDVIATGSTTSLITATDVGIAWITEDVHGMFSIWQYNTSTETTERLSLNDIPRFAIPGSLKFLAGFLWVGFSYATYPSGGYSDEEFGYVYYQRGSQRGFLGPMHAVENQNSGVSVIDLYGDDLLIHYGDRLWAYNTTAGGIVNLGEGPSGSYSDATKQAVLFGDDVFIPLSYIDRWELTKYDPGLSPEGYLDTGRFDFGWPGMDKVLMDITVSTDPLPANCTVGVGYSVDGGAFSTHAITSNVAGTTVHRFVVSSPASPVNGESFELRVILGTSSEDLSPRVREIMARASIDELEFTYELQLDLSDREDAPISEATVLANLNTVAARAGFVTFENPWQVAEHDDPTTEVVKVVSVGQPEIGDEGIRYCTIRLRGRDAVGGISEAQEEMQT